MKTYGERANSHPSPVAKKLLSIIEKKKTNICSSIDATKKDDILRIARATAPYVCVIKTHIDIVSNFDDDLTEKLGQIASEFDVLIWEDRKFADIGNTVKLQYGSGIYKIAQWAHLTNAHSLPGDGIVKGLGEVGKPLGRGLILLSEMSSAGNLFTPEYSKETVDMADRYPDFVMGLVAMKRPTLHSRANPTDLLIFTPGVSLVSKGDGLGQQYRTPETVLANGQSDILVVGRGIYSSENGYATNEEIIKRCEEYRKVGWEAYEKNLAN